MGRKKYTIQDMQEIAYQRGGRCLSKVYSGSHKLQWECKDGHTFWMRSNDVINNHWCTDCSKKLSERICRKYFEMLFKTEFPSKKPKWLVNEQGNRLELDGYNKDLGIAFEYQGKQHYQALFDFHDINKTKIHDEIKVKTCKEKGIKLIVIPYIVKHKELQQYIVNECKKKRISLPDQIEYVDYTKLNVFSPSKLEEIQKIAQEYGGECLSKVYVGVDTQMDFKCSKGHLFSMTPHSLKHGAFCWECGVEKRNISKMKKTFEKVKKIAIEKGGICLSEEYLYWKQKLKFRCREDHEWFTTAHNIIQGYWCMECAGKIKLTIEQMQEIALERGGWCLSQKYSNSHTELWWQCGQGHVWEAKPYAVKNGHWCRKCRFSSVGRYKKFPHKHSF